MRLVRTPQIDALLARNVDSVPADSLGEKWINHEYILSLAKQFGTPLHSILHGSGVYFDPPKPPPPRSKDYEELMARLRAEDQERQYRSLLQETEASAAVNTSELKEVKEQLTTILNIMVSIVAIAWAFWHWTAAWDLAARTLVSLFAGIGIGIAEVVVYLGYKRRVSEARANEHTAKEQRTVVKRVVFGKEGVEKIDPAANESESEEAVSGLRFRKRAVKV